MSKFLFRYFVVCISFSVVILTLYSFTVHVIHTIPMDYRKHTEMDVNQTVIKYINQSDTQFRYDELITDFEVQVNQTLDNCFIPESDSNRFKDTLDFIGRHQ